MMWKEIKCKECGTQDKRLFLLSPPKDTNDVYCIDCKEPEIEKRAKK